MLQPMISCKIVASLLCILVAACGGGGGTAEPQPVMTNPTDNSTGSTGTGNQTGSNAPPASSSSTPTPQTPSNTSGSSDTPAGNPSVAPSADATNARFNQPLGIAVDAAGNLYIADAGNNTIRKVASSGVVTTLAGSPGASGSTDGTGAAARFSFLKGLTVDNAGNVYAVDNSAIRKITPAGVVTTLAGTSGVLGDTDGEGAAARFHRPWGITVDNAGNLYVADTGNYLVRKISPTGMVSTHAGIRGVRSTVNGSASTATFLGPVGIAIDGGGNLYVTDWFGPPAPNVPEASTIIRKIAADGTVTTLAGSIRTETTPSAFNDTFAIAADTQGNVYVVAMRSVQKINPSGVANTLAGPSDQFQSLHGVTVDGNGNLYVTDESNHTVSQIRQDGTITLVAGKPRESGSTDVAQ